MNALVTGAGGFLGLYVAEQLVESASGSAMARRSCPQLDALGVETVRADLRDREAVIAACRGIDVVFTLPASKASPARGNTTTRTTRLAPGTSSRAA